MLPQYYYFTKCKGDVLMIDYNKPIPKTEFPFGLIIVSNPSMDPFVYLDDEFDCDSAYNHWDGEGGMAVPGSSPSIMARKTVRDMLHEAEALLPEGHHFRIYDAYRPVAIQQFFWDYFRSKFRNENPEFSDEELDNFTRTCVSMPSYNILRPAVHSTGGAVDLTIVGPDGEVLEMGTDFDEFNSATWTYAFEPDSGTGLVNETARDNRRLLYNVMTEVGFTNLPSEWWHFDYGDGMWAQIKNENAIYAGRLDAEARNIVPYKNMDLVRKADHEQQECIGKMAEIVASCEEIGNHLITEMQ